MNSSGVRSNHDRSSSAPQPRLVLCSAIVWSVVAALHFFALSATMAHVPIPASYHGEYDSTSPIMTGTTIMAAVYDGGVVMGADSRTSTGNYVANRVTDKITSLAENIYICRSGSAADTQTISDYVRHMLKQRSIEVEGLPEVKLAANIAMQLAYGNKNNLQAGLIVAGWDDTAGPSVWAIPLGGTLIQVPFTVGGSGSSYVLGFCDKAWKPNMTREECEAFVRKTVSLAISRDGSSGGMIRTLTIDKTGAHRHLTMGHEVPVHFEEMQGTSVQ